MAHDNTQVTRRLIEDVWNNGKLPVLEELLDASFEGRDPLRGPLNAEQYRNAVKGFRLAFPDVRFELTAVVASHHHVTTRWTMCCTHLGPFLGTESSGKSAQVTGLNLAELRNGKLISEYSEWDALALFRQLGLEDVTLPMAVRRPVQQHQRAP